MLNKSSSIIQCQTKLLDTKDLKNSFNLSSYYDEWSGLLSFWTDRGTKERPRVWRRPKLIEEGESEVLSFDTAETRLSIFSCSTCIAVEESSVFCTACLRCVLCLCFFDGLVFLKNSNEVGNLCLSTRCCCRFL